MKVKVLPGQNIWDIALQYTGILDNAYLIAIANGIVITDEIGGCELVIGECDIDKKIVAEYRQATIIPVSNPPVTMVDNVNMFDVTFDLTFD
ncbi:MAG: hypothetical protein ACRDDZ_11120 [Marinifilaceae bacterium]